ncbi:MAG: histidine phosphatase family protein [Acidimicrobiales bacterium]
MPTRPKPPEPTVVLFVRHGLTPTTGKEMPEAGAGPSLSEEGRRQAEDAGRHIADWRPSLPPLGALYTSPLTRARETAAIVGKALDLAPVENRGLADVDAGEWAGTPLKELAKLPEWPTVVHYPSGFRFPGGEHLSQMHGRVVGTVRDLVESHAGQAVVVVSHADPIKAVLADALGAHLDLFQRVVVSPASVSAVSYARAGPSVLLVNWTRPAADAPLPGKLKPGPGTANAGPRSRR